MYAQWGKSLGLLCPSFHKSVKGLLHGMVNQLASSLSKGLQLLSQGGSGGCSNLWLGQWLFVPCDAVQGIKLKPGEAFCTDCAFFLYILVDKRWA